MSILLDLLFFFCDNRLPKLSIFHFLFTFPIPSVKRGPMRGFHGLRGKRVYSERGDRDEDWRQDRWMDGLITDGYYVNDTDNFITAFNDSNAKKKKRFFWRPAHRSIVSFLVLRTRTRVIMIRSMQFAMQRAILTRSFISWIMYLYFLYIWRLIGRPLPVQKKKVWNNLKNPCSFHISSIFILGLPGVFYAKKDKISAALFWQEQQKQQRLKKEQKMEAT